MNVKSLTRFFTKHLQTLNLDFAYFLEQLLLIAVSITSIHKKQIINTLIYICSIHNLESRTHTNQLFLQNYPVRTALDSSAS